MIPAPILNIETTHFYVHGLEAGAYLFKNEQHRVMLGISYMPLEFDASDSGDNRMKQLDDRDASAFAALSYSYTHPLVTVSAKLSGDISGKSDGLLADVRALHRFQIGQLGLTPMVGVIWASEKFNEYYYGITAAESARSGLAAYTPDSSTTGYVRLFADYTFNDHLSVWLEGSWQPLASEVKDSPMVERSNRMGFGGGVNWRF